MVMKRREKVKKLHVVLSELNIMREVLVELKKLNQNLSAFSDYQRALELTKSYLASIDKTLEEINFTLRNIRWTMGGK